MKSNNNCYYSYRLALKKLEYKNRALVVLARFLLLLTVLAIRN